MNTNTVNIHQISKSVNTSLSDKNFDTSNKIFDIFVSFCYVNFIYSYSFYYSFCIMYQIVRFDMKLSFYSNAKKLLVGTLLAVGCLQPVSVCLAEAKAFEYDTVLRGSYIHTMNNEFFTRQANMYNTVNQFNNWGEVIVREESGEDGSVTKSWLIGNIRRKDNNFIFDVRRHVIQKLDNWGKIKSTKVEDVCYNVNLYHRMGSGVKLEWLDTGSGPCADIDGEYTVRSEYPQMSQEAAIYVLSRFMNSRTEYRKKLQGAAILPEGKDLAEVHIIKLIEQHSDHAVTRGTYQVDASGTILEYDVVQDKWFELTR